MERPAIFIGVPGDYAGRRYIPAQIRERVKGPSRYRYLVWRNGTAQEFYLGKLALQKKRPLSSTDVAGKTARRRLPAAAAAGSSGSGARCRVKHGDAEYQK
jgi:hypothetical protein